MPEKRNIINFQQRRNSSSPSIQLPQLVKSAQRSAKNHLKTALPEVFTQIDNNLFALSNKAEDQELQSYYFDTMRNFRLQQDDIQHLFFTAADNGFYSSLRAASSKSSSGDSLDGISLMNDDELELTVAVGNMADNAESLYREALAALTARFDFLIEDMEITKDNNPLRPEVLSQAFLESIEIIDTEIKTKLVVLKLFDQYLLQEIGPMYDAINEDLVAAGVLPRIKATVRKSESAETETDSSEDTASKAEDAQKELSASAENLFGSIQELLQIQRNLLAKSGAAPVEEGTKSSFVAYFPTHDVVSALSQLQFNNYFFMDKDTDKSSADIIKQTIQNSIGGVVEDEVEPSQINQVDMDTIDIVSMLFDFILDDPGLSVYLKAQLARLQIPMVKVAILDKDFFAKKTHPARQLLNELAYASNDLEDEGIEENSTYQMIVHIVDRCLKEFSDETELFSTLLNEFTTFIEQERITNKEAEEAVVTARDTVAKEIQRRITDNQVPPLVSNILISAWKDVLTHLYLRDGIGSTGWNTAIKVADDLIWSVQPKIIISERKQLISIIPGLLNGLRDGLTLIQFDEKATEEFFKGLESLHIASLRGKSSKSETDAREHGQVVSGTEKLAPEMEYLMDEIISASDEASTVIESYEDLEAIQTDIKEMALGTWVEFIDAETERRSRGKLVWKCDFTGEYTFVDRKYKVIADVSYSNLVYEFSIGRATYIEDVPLIDRALDRVIDGIKQTLESNDNPTEH